MKKKTPGLKKKEEFRMRISTWLNTWSVCTNAMLRVCAERSSTVIPACETRRKDFLLSLHFFSSSFQNGMSNEIKLTLLDLKRRGYKNTLKCLVVNMQLPVRAPFSLHIDSNLIELNKIKERNPLN